MVIHVVDILEPPLSPVALECQLPWKRAVCSLESRPIPSMVTYLLPDDNQPPLAQVPSWADNLDYNNLPAISPRSDTDIGSEHDSRASNNLTSLTSLPLIQVTDDSSVSPSATPSAGLLIVASQNDVDITIAPDAGSPAMSDPDLVSASRDLSTDSEEDVEIKPFGKLNFNLSGSSSALKNTADATSSSGNESETAVKFSITGADNSSDDEPS